MRASRTHTVAYGAALTALLTCAAAHAESSGEPLPAFGPGEQSTYRLKYLGISAGTATVTVGDVSPDAAPTAEPIWPIVMLAKSDSLLGLFPVRDRIITFWDAHHARIISTELFADEGHHRHRQKVEMDHARGTARVTKQKEGEASVQSNVQIQPGTQDMAAATFALRGKRLEVGQSYTIPVFTGSKSFPLRASVETVQKIKTALGEREVFRLRIQTAFSGKFESKRDMFAYLTTDGRHLPVRIEASFLLGTIVAELTDYKQGRVLASLSPHPG